MQVQNTQANKVSFGVKVPTKQLVDFMSGIRTDETNQVFLKLTGLSNEKMLTTMSSDVIEFSKSYCTKTIADSDPIFKKLIDIKKNLSDFFRAAISDKSNSNLDKITELSNAKDAEKINLLKKLPDVIDLPEIKLPLQ